MNIEIFKIKNEYYNKIKNYSYKRNNNIISYMSYYYKIKSIKFRIYLIIYNFKIIISFLKLPITNVLLLFFLSFIIIKLSNRSFIIITILFIFLIINNFFCYY